MTDKHIKKRVDVSQCEYYSMEHDSCKDTISGSCVKENCQIFRLLQTIKAKEQECERLKNELLTYGATGICETCTEKSVLKCDQLKVENEELKQTLTEIKPILELYANSKIGEEQLDGTYKITVKNSNVLGETYITFDPRPAKQALQKISECEVEND